MKTIALVNNKGGVGKTTSSANLAAYLSYIGKRVLLVDTDGQSNLTQHFNIYTVERSICDAYSDYLKDPQNAKAPLVKINENLYLVPASRGLNNMEKLLTTFSNNQSVLKKLLKPFQDKFDYCIIDCPPSLGLLTDNAIIASDSIVIPVEAAQFSINGVTGIVEYLNNLKYHHDLDIELTGAFMAKYDERKSITVAVNEQARKIFGNTMFNTVVRINTAIEQAQADGEDIFTYSKDSNSALDYADLSEELLKRLESNTVNA
jgi:chromosome partitioning protein